MACRTNVVLFNMSYLGKFYLCGPDVQKAADYLFTSNTKRDINRIIYTCMLNHKGGIEGDCTVTSVEPGSSGIVDPIFKDKAFYIGNLYINLNYLIFFLILHLKFVKLN